MKITPIRHNSYKNDKYKQTTSPVQASFKAQDCDVQDDDILSTFFRLPIKKNYKKFIIDNFKPKEIITACKRGLFDDDLFYIIKKNIKDINQNPPIYQPEIGVRMFYNEYCNHIISHNLKKIQELSRYSDEDWEKIVELGITPKYLITSDIYAESLDTLLNFPKAKQQKIVSFVNNNKQRPISLDDAIIFSNMPDEDFEKIKDLLYFKTCKKEALEKNLTNEQKFLKTTFLTAISKYDSAKVNEIKEILTNSDYDYLGSNTQNLLLELFENEKCFEKAKERNLYSKKGPLQVKVPISLLNKFAQMSDEEFSGYTKLSNELCKNRNLLRDVDGLPANDAMLENILFSFSPVHLRLVDNKVLKHAMSLRHQNFNDFLKSIKNLERLNLQLQDTIFEKINQLTYPEQKMNKLLVLSDIAMNSKSNKENNHLNNNNLNNNNLNYYSDILNYFKPTKSQQFDSEILNYIIPTKTTQEQLDLARQIFSNKTKSNEENINTFFEKFSFPEKSQKVLHKFFTPIPIEKQIEAIDKMIKKTESDPNLNQEKKTKQLAQLKNTKQKIIQNPDEFRRFRPTKNNIQKLAAYIESYVNIPQSDTEFYNYLYKSLYSLYDIEISDELKQKLSFDEKGLSELFKQKNKFDNNFKDRFKELLLLLNKDASKNLSELRENIQQNIKTKSLFASHGLNYEKWTKFDKGLKKDINLVSNGKEKCYTFRLSDDDDITRNLFFGNHVNCCTAINRFNAYCAPTYLLSTFIRGLELVDDADVSYGNSMCYFATIEEKENPKQQKLVFVIDSFVANDDLLTNKKLTKELFEFGKIVASEMGRPDAKIILGTNNNKLDVSELEKHSTKTTSLICGDTPRVYLDFYKRLSNANSVASYYEYPEKCES